MKIAIDGPASSGKSTMAKRIAEELEIIYLDTGAMYRAVTLYFLNKGLKINQVQDIESYLKDCQIQFKHHQGQVRLHLNGKDVSKEIRSNQVNDYVSEVSAHPKVREYLVRQQQAIAKEEDIVMDGRDIGTVVLPDADFKFYLTASAEVRAQRRYQENLDKGLSDLDLEAIKESIIQRDYYDSHRQHSPLTKAEDAIEIDTSDMTIEENVKLMLHYINEAY